nr:immunoglobulin heavy chain junction region [Macaca mulatta]MOW90408.1 immunoglobulin heavy chain junction region [Macaca mulatta]
CARYGAGALAAAVGRFDVW